MPRSVPGTRFCRPARGYKGEQKAVFKRATLQLTRKFLGELSRRRRP